MIEIGKMLSVDLSSRAVDIRSLPEDILALFLGGRGLAAVLSHQFIPDGCDPLGPKNVLSICNGLLTGTAAPASARTHFCALSPLTGVLGSANAGGFFGAALRSCNIQCVVITGTADEPVYLHIDPSGIRIHPAVHLWGLDTRQCEAKLKDELSDTDLQIAAIGPAGENRCAIGCIMLGSHSAAGRTGLGAVMGAKRLKAIAVKGERPNVSAGYGVRKAKADYLKPILRSDMFKTLRTHGQSGYIRWCNAMGMLGTRNYQSTVFEQADRICGSSLADRVGDRRACFACPVRCKADTVVQDGPYAGESGPRPEFETIAALGARCGQADPDAMLSLSYLCNRLGMDTISAGSAIAFAMELFQTGVITREDTQGLALRWGDAACQRRLLEQMAHRSGFGSVLADGVRAAARRLGRGSRPLAMHSKGLELCAYDPRASMSTALSYAVSGRGGDFASIFASAEYRWDANTAERKAGHRLGADRFSPVAKAAIVRRCGLCSAVIDALGICKVLALGIPAAFDLQAEADLVSALTGRSTNPGDLFVIGERIVCLERLFNWRHWRGGDIMDTLPQRFLAKSPSCGDATADRPMPLAAMRSEYYDLMGWDRQGRPFPEKVRELGLGFLDGKPMGRLGRFAV